MRWHTTGTLVFLVGLIASPIVLAILHMGWTADDAYITFRYAQNLIDHGQPTWNVGEDPVQGYTGFLWPAIIAAGMWAGMEPVLLTQSLGYILFLLLMLIFWLTLRTLELSNQQQIEAFILFTVAPWYLHVASGLETLLFTLLALWVLQSLLAGRTALLSGLLALAALTRPEGLALIGAVWFADIIQNRHLRVLIEPRETPIATAAWIALLLAAPAYLAAWAYYGSPMPNTYYAKQSGHGWVYVIEFVLSVGFLLIAVWRSKPRPALRPEHCPAALAAVLFTLALLVAYAPAALVMNYSQRFFLPLFPLVIISAVVLLGARPVRGWVIAHIAFSCLMLFAYARWAEHYADMLTNEHAQAAAWISEHAQPDDTLLVYVDAGIVPYHTRLHTVDFGALNDEYLARHTDPADRVEYFYAQRADLVLMSTGETIGVPGAVELRERIMGDPRWGCYRRAWTSKQRNDMNYNQAVFTRSYCQAFEEYPKDLHSMIAR
jgi:hypothetical protein